MVQLYYAPKTRAFRPRWLLEELGIPFELVPVPLATRDHKKPEYLAVHPLGKLPALRDGSLTLFESAAICAYLADKFPEKGLAPAPHLAERGYYYQWLFYATVTLEETVSTLAALRGAPEATRDAKSLLEVSEQLQQRLVPLEDWLRSRRFLLGDGFSAADVVLGSILFWAQALGQINDMPSLEGYVARLKDRPSYQRARKD